MIKLGGFVNFKPINEAEYTHVGYGKYKEKGKEKDKTAQTFKKDDKGNFTPISSDDKGGKAKDVKKDVPKVNIFDKPASTDNAQAKHTKVGPDSPEVQTIAKYAGVREKFLADFINQHKLDAAAVANFVENGSREDIKDFFTAAVGNPGNKYQKKIIDKFGEKGDSKEEPKPSQPKPQRKGNPEVNKAVRAKADSFGITPEKLGKEEYQKKMAQAAVEALTDSNYHGEARELIAKLEGKPELAEKPDYPDVRDPKFNEKMSVIKAKYASVYSDDVDDDARKLGTTASQESGWSGDDAVDGIAYTLRMKGFHKLADTIQSVIKENKSTRLKKLV